MAHLEGDASVRCVWDIRSELGEGPIWNDTEQAVYFTDIKGKQVHCYHPGTGRRQSWHAPKQVAFLLPLPGGAYLCGCPDGLYRFSGATGTFTHEISVESGLTRNRLNDGCVDVAGRGWFGTMDDTEKDSSGSLYSLQKGPEGPVLTQHDSGYFVANGPAVSPDGRFLYACDTPQGLVYRFDLTADGRIDNKRVFIQLSGAHGYPDGVVTDSAGNLWIGAWGGGKVMSFTPQGEERLCIPIPAANVTKVAFGGPKMKTVFVTTARKSLADDVLRELPLSGSLFSFEVEIPGWTTPILRL